MGGSALTVTIPGTPPRELSPNARVHWRVKARHTRAYRETAYLATVAAMRETTQFDSFWTIVVNVTYAWEKGRRSLDDDNAWALFKAGRDGVAAAIAVNDRAFRCGSVEQMRDPAGVGYTTVELKQEVVGDG